MGPLHGKLGAGHQIIHVGQHAIEAVIDGVDVHRHRDAVPARDLGGARHRRRIVGVDMQQARAHNFFRCDALRLQAQAIVAPPEHGALAGGLVDQDVGGLVRAIFTDFEVIQVDAALAQALELYAAALVVADRSDVFHAQPQLRAGHHGAGHLTAGTQDLALECNLARIGGKSAKARMRVSVAFRPTPTTSNLRSFLLPGWRLGVVTCFVKSLVWFPLGGGGSFWMVKCFSLVVRKNSCL